MNTRRKLWQERHGPIPKGWVVHNLNGNKGDVRFENLAAVPRKPDNLNCVIAPYRQRIRTLEREIKLLKELEDN